MTGLVIAILIPTMLGMVSIMLLMYKILVWEIRILARISWVLVSFGVYGYFYIKGRLQLSAKSI